MRPSPIRRILLVALVAFCLPVGLGAVASAQDTTQDPTSGYGQTTTTGGDFATTNQEQPANTTEDDEGDELPAQASGGDDESGSAPSQAAPTPAPNATSTPSTLAFTGFEALAVGLVGVALMGAALVLQRRRREN